MQTIEELGGAILGVVVLIDVFFLVLYARANDGLISRYLPYWAWRLMVWASRPLGRRRSTFLTMAGPTILLSVLIAWALLMSLAAALIIHPNLGTGIRATSGETPTDFLTALYVGGSSLSFVGVSDFAPQTGAFRFFFLLMSLIGVSLISLAITYLMQVYSSLHTRNTLGLKVHLMSAETDDAADLIAGIGANGMFEAGYNHLVEWAAEIAQAREAHHFYPVLFYFRFRSPYYSVSQTALIALDTATLIKTALDDEAYGWLKESAALDQLWRGSVMELGILAANFIPKVDIDAPQDEATRERWRRRYAAGVERLQRAGIRTKASGAEEYVALRTQWDRYITRMAPLFGYELDEIDPALAKVK